MPDFKNCSSGAAVEIAASRGDNPSQFPFQVPLTHYRDCNFSFAGAKTSAYNQILNYEKNFNITGDKIIPDVYNFCAAFQLSVTRHLCQRTQRAIEFVDRLNLLPEDRRTLVNIVHNCTCRIFQTLKFAFFLIFFKKAFKKPFFKKINDIKIKDFNIISINCKLQK